MKFSLLTLTALSAATAAAGVATAKSQVQPPDTPVGRSGLLGGNLGAKWRIAVKNVGLKTGALRTRDVDDEGQEVQVDEAPLVAADGDAASLTFEEEDIEEGGSVDDGDMEKRDVDDEDDGDEDEEKEEPVANGEEKGELPATGEEKEELGANEEKERLAPKGEVPPHREQGVYTKLKDTGAAVLGKRDVDEYGEDEDDDGGELTARDVEEDDDIWTPEDDGGKLTARDVEPEEDDDEDDDDEDDDFESEEDAPKLAARDLAEEEDGDVDHSLEGYDHELVARSAVAEDDEGPHDDDNVDYSLEGYDHALVARQLAFEDADAAGATWAPGDSITRRDVESDGIDYSLEGYDHELVARDAAFSRQADNELHARDVEEDDEDDEDESEDVDEAPIAARSVAGGPAAPTRGFAVHNRHHKHGHGGGIHRKLFGGKKTRKNL